MSVITKPTMLAAATALAAQVTDADLAKGSLYPALDTLREVSARVAVAVAEHAYASGTARVMPRPIDLDAFVRGTVWSPTYLPATRATHGFGPDNLMKY
jgi:malate dehydrogenase (oxaloacetate-decarboxylating)(NADP+)